MPVLYLDYQKLQDAIEAEYVKSKFAEKGLSKVAWGGLLSYIFDLFQELSPNTQQQIVENLKAEEDQGAIELKTWVLNMDCHIENIPGFSKEDMAGLIANSLRMMILNLEKAQQRGYHAIATILYNIAMGRPLFTPDQIVEFPITDPSASNTMTEPVTQNMNISG